MTKRKQKYCIVCGKRIRTGYKYCYEHRNTKEGRNEVSGGGQWILAGVIAFFTLWMIVNQINKLHIVWIWIIWIVVFGLIALGMFAYMKMEERTAHAEN